MGNIRRFAYDIRNSKKYLILGLVLAAAGAAISYWLVYAMPFLNLWFVLSIVEFFLFFLAGLALPEKSAHLELALTDALFSILILSFVAFFGYLFITYFSVFGNSLFDLSGGDVLSYFGATFILTFPLMLFVYFPGRLGAFLGVRFDLFRNENSPTKTDLFYKVLPTSIVALIFGAILLFGGSMLGFGADLDLLSPQQLLLGSFTILFLPSLFGIAVCNKLFPKYTALWTTLIVSSSPLGFYLGAIPSRPSPTHWLATTFPVFLGALLIISYLHLRKTTDKQLSRKITNA